jgi:O-6-methylguanine DNA methyltransferase
MLLHHATISTPIGDMFALASESELWALEFGGPERHDRLQTRMRKWFPPHEIEEGDTPMLARTREWLAHYFDGASADSNALPIAMHGAPFERRVWEALLQIPPGETRSYGRIAKALGAEGASRAVGMANGANPIAIVVPCHRVIGSNGALTGYGGGLDRKTWLLNHERRWSTERLF